MTRVETVQNAKTDWEKDFEEFFKTSYPRVLAYLNKLSGQSELAGDICQDVFAGLWEKKYPLPGAEEEKLYYLLSIARNAFFQHTRKSLREQKELSDLLLRQASTEAPVSKLELSEQQGLLQETLEAAPEAKKKFFLLNREEGLTYKQIAQQEGVSEKTVERYIGHILKSLRTRLTTLFFW
jgi:RNA polymerase sigma factor (sigma-70 family)